MSLAGFSPAILRDCAAWIRYSCFMNKTSLAIRLNTLRYCEGCLLCHLAGLQYSGTFETPDELILRGSILMLDNFVDRGV